MGMVTVKEIAEEEVFGRITRVLMNMYKMDSSEEKA